MKEEAVESEEPVWCLKKAQEEKPSRQCPYLDTIDRCVMNISFLILRIYV